MSGNRLFCGHKLLHTCRGKPKAAKHNVSRHLEGAQIFTPSEICTKGRSLQVLYRSYLKLIVQNLNPLIELHILADTLVQGLHAVWGAPEVLRSIQDCAKQVDSSLLKKDPPNQLCNLFPAYSHLAWDTQTKLQACSVCFACLITLVAPQRSSKVLCSYQMKDTKQQVPKLCSKHEQRQKAFE